MFSVIFRFIYELGTFSNNKIENNYNDIYRDKSELKKRIEDLCKACIVRTITELINIVVRMHLLLIRMKVPNAR